MKLFYYYVVNIHILILLKFPSQRANWLFKGFFFGGPSLVMTSLKYYNYVIKSSVFLIYPGLTKAGSGSWIFLNQKKTRAISRSNANFTSSIFALNKLNLPLAKLNIAYTVTGARVTGCKKSLNWINRSSFHENFDVRHICSLAYSSFSVWSLGLIFWQANQNNTYLIQHRILFHDEKGEYKLMLKALTTS